MSEAVILGVFAAWVLFFAWRGYRKGVYAAILSLLGLAGAYVAVFLWGAKLAGMFNQLGIESPYAAFTAYPLLFILTSTAISEIPPAIFPALRKITIGTRLAGLLLGTASGALSGLFVVWFLGVVAGAKADNSDEEQVSAGLAHGLLQSANEFVATTVELGARGNGMSQEQARTLKAVVREPNSVGDGVQKLMQSQEMRSLMQSPDAIQMMARNDTGSLQRHSEFKALMGSDGMQQLTQVWQQENAAGAEQAEAFVAEQLSYVWRRLQYLKHDSRVKAIMQDEEFQKLAQENQPMALLSHPKFRELVGIVMENDIDMDKVDFSALAEQELQSQREQSDNLEPSIVKPYKAQSIYIWQDDSGNTQYSDYDSIPEHKRTNAKEIKR